MRCNKLRWLSAPYASTKRYDTVSTAAAVEVGHLEFAPAPTAIIGRRSPTAGHQSTLLHYPSRQMMELSNSFNLRNRDEDHRFYHSRSHENHAGSVIARLESTLEAIIDKLAEGEELSVEFQSRRRTFQGPAGIQEQQVRFPGRSPLEARKFGRRTEYQWRSGPLLISSLARLLLVLQLAHQALTSGVIFTKRYIVS